MNKNIHKPFGIGYLGFTLAEMMVVMLILSIVMAAMAPVMTTRNKLDQSSPWSWADNGSDAYYGIGDAQVAMIGQEEAKDNDIGSRLVINAPAGKKHILLKQGDTTLGYLNMTNNSNVLTGSIQGNTTQGSRSVAVGILTTPSGGNSTAIGYASKATGEASTAVGSNSKATGDHSSAFGVSVASGKESLAVGYGNNVSEESSIAIGSDIILSSKSSIAMGASPSAISGNSISLGKSAVSSGVSSIAIGDEASTGYETSSSWQQTGAYATSIGRLSKATGGSSIAIGTQAQAGDNTGTTGFNIAAGYQSAALGDYSLAMGTQSNAGAHAIAMGYLAKASGTNSIAIGRGTNYNGSSGAQTSGAQSIALGYYASALGTNSIALGNNASAENPEAIAIGSNVSSLDTSIAIGKFSKASYNSVAIGFGDNATTMTDATGGGAIAIGRRAEATGSSGIAIGLSAKAKGDDNIAIGRGACQYVTGSNKVCIGANSGPASSSSWTTDNVERIFIGGKSKFDNGSAVLEVHNTSEKRSMGGYGNVNQTAVVVHGALIVSGPIYNYAKDRGDTSYKEWNFLEKGKGENDAFLQGGNSSWYSEYTSDRRLKYVGKENTSGFDKIRELKVFNYTFKKDEKKTPHVGVIAQDLQKVFPDAVSKAKDGFLRIRFEDMFYAMINAIKELDSRITALEKENQQLKEQNKALDARLKAIEAKLK